MRQLGLRLTFIVFSLIGTAYSLANDTPASNSEGSETDVESLYDQLDQQSDQATKKEESVAPKAEEEKPRRKKKSQYRPHRRSSRCRKPRPSPI